MECKNLYGAYGCNDFQKLILRLLVSKFLKSVANTISKLIGRVISKITITHAFSTNVIFFDFTSLIIHSSSLANHSAEFGVASWLFTVATLKVIISHGQKLVRSLFLRILDANCQDWKIFSENVGCQFSRLENTFCKF